MNLWNNKDIKYFKAKDRIFKAKGGYNDYILFYCSICNVEVYQKSISKHKKGIVHIKNVGRKYRHKYEKLYGIMVDNWNIYDDWAHELKSSINEIKILNETITNMEAIDPPKNDNEEGPEICNICTLYKKNICFTCCGHTCCSYCSLRINKCHVCNHELENKHKLKMYI